MKQKKETDIDFFMTKEATAVGAGCLVIVLGFLTIMVIVSYSVFSILIKCIK